VVKQRIFSIGLLIILIAGLLLLSSCMQDQSLERGIFPGSGEDGGSEGTDALVMSLAKPSMTYFPNDEFVFTVDIENKGFYDILSLQWGVSGYDPAFVKNVRYAKAPTALSGTKGTMVGQILSFLVEGEIGALERAFPINMQVSACYPYETAASFVVCIDADGQNNPGDCDQSDDLKVGKGQGAPVAVSEISYDSRRTRDGAQALFEITLAKVGSENQLRYFNEAVLNDFCAARLSDTEIRQYENVVRITKLTLSNIDLLANKQCSLQPGNIVNLARSPTIRCYVDLPRSSDFTSKLDISFIYGVKQVVSQEILVRESFS